MWKRACPWYMDRQRRGNQPEYSESGLNRLDTRLELFTASPTHRQTDRQAGQQAYFYTTGRIMQFMYVSCNVTRRNDGLLLKDPFRDSKLFCPSALSSSSVALSLLVYNDMLSWDILCCPFSVDRISVVVCIFQYCEISGFHCCEYQYGCCLGNCAIEVN